MELWVKQKSLEMGFDLAGICPAQQFREHLALQDWVAQGMHGTMHYLEKNLSKRMDPRAVMPEAESIIVCAVNYNAEYPYSIDVTHPPPTPSHRGRGEARGWISRYAWGDDYHDTLQEKLRALCRAIEQKVSGSYCKPYVDTGPVMERVFAKNAGLGWIGKNTCVIHEKIGSWLFLGAILTTLKLRPDDPATDHCGKCRACLDACPTQALTAPHQLDARKCIAYLTIEYKGPIDPPLARKMGQHLYGCDICQDVCPWNRKAKTTNNPHFQPRPGFFHPKLTDFHHQLMEGYPKEFKASPLKRAKKEGLLRNLAIVQANASLISSEDRDTAFSN